MSHIASPTARCGARREKMRMNFLRGWKQIWSEKEKYILDMQHSDGVGVPWENHMHTHQRVTIYESHCVLLSLGHAVVPWNESFIDLHRRAQQAKKHWNGFSHLYLIGSLLHRVYAMRHSTRAANTACYFHANLSGLFSETCFRHNHTLDLSTAS